MVATVDLGFASSTQNAETPWLRLVLYVAYGKKSGLEALCCQRKGGLRGTSLASIVVLVKRTRRRLAPGDGDGAPNKRQFSAAGRSSVRQR
jgi:hypothetical protein